MNLLRACYDWRVLAALGVLGLGIYLVAPGLAAGAIPLLLVAACPISMLLMMKVMSGQPQSSDVQPEPVDGDRIDGLRQELAALGRQQRRLESELRAIEAAQPDISDTGDAIATTSTR